MMMSKMYCPQCGRELGLDSEVRFCRYCGFALSDTRDTLRGYTQIKREGYKYTNLSYILLLVLFWIQYFRLVPWESFWGGNFLLISIFGFVFGLWFMGNWVVDKPAKYVKNHGRKEPAELTQGETTAHPRVLPSSQAVPIPTPGARNTDTSEIVERPSVVEDTTRQLNKYSSD